MGVKYGPAKYPSQANLNKSRALNIYFIMDI